MKWLLALETENDPIPACRLMNIFRRKWVKVVTLGLSAHAGGFSLLAVVDSPETDVEHVFNFLRGLGGVRHVTYYRPEPGALASFVLVDAEADSSSVAKFLQAYPAARLTLASQGKYLYEIPAENSSGRVALQLAGPAFLALARARSCAPRSELVGACQNNGR